MKFLGHHPQSPPLIYPHPASATLSILPRYPGPLPLAFCPSVSNLHSPPFALLTLSLAFSFARASFSRSLFHFLSFASSFFSSYTFEPSTQQPRCPSCEVSRTRVSFVRVARIRWERGGWRGETKRPPLTSGQGVRRPRSVGVRRMRIGPGLLQLG